LQLAEGAIGSRMREIRMSGSEEGFAGVIRRIYSPRVTGKNYRIWLGEIKNSLLFSVQDRTIRDACYARSSGRAVLGKWLKSSYDMLSYMFVNQIFDEKINYSCRC